MGTTLIFPWGSASWYSNASLRNLSSFLALDMDIPDKTAEKAGFDCCAEMRATGVPLDEVKEHRKVGLIREHCSVSEGFPSNK